MTIPSDVKDVKSIRAFLADVRQQVYSVVYFWSHCPKERLVLAPSTNQVQTAQAVVNGRDSLVSGSIAPFPMPGPSGLGGIDGASCAKTYEPNQGQLPALNKIKNLLKDPELVRDPVVELFPDAGK
jgi:hypothetical protein